MRINLSYTMDLNKKKSTKKWTKFEEKILLEYLSEKKNFELPTAQVFYKKFLEKSKIEATWEMVKWKVRYLKRCFIKAEDWRRNTGAGILQEDEEEGIHTVNEKLRKMCPYYDQLLDIFGEKKVATELDMFDTDISTNDYFVAIDDPLDTQNGTEDIIEVEHLDESNIEADPNIPNCSTQNSSQKQSQKVSSYAEKLKRKNPSDALSQLANAQTERNETMNRRLKFEEEKFAKELEFNREKFYAEMELRKHEIELKKLQFEKEERLAKYELELKYKSNNTNI